MTRWRGSARRMPRPRPCWPSAAAGRPPPPACPRTPRSCRRRCGRRPTPSAEPALAAELQYVRAMLPMAAGRFADVEAPMLEAGAAGPPRRRDLPRPARAHLPRAGGVLRRRLRAAPWRSRRAVAARRDRGGRRRDAVARDAGVRAQPARPPRRGAGRGGDGGGGGGAPRPAHPGGPRCARTPGAVALAAGDGAAARTPARARAGARRRLHPPPARPPPARGGLPAGGRPRRCGRGARRACRSSPCAPSTCRPPSCPA